MATTTARRARTTRSSAPPEVPVAAAHPIDLNPAASPDTLAVLGAAFGSGAGSTTAGLPHPPMLVGGAPAGVGTGWVSGQMITHLWSYDSADGVWVYVDGPGWKRLSPASASGVSHMVVIATMATTHNTPVAYHEDAAGQIDQFMA
ncbi:MAG: hypothetical protein ACRCXL_02015 [Dermatophilaceae bacterium]